MYGFIIVLILIVCILLILIVLVQNSKGGGLASNFGASNQVMGVRKTTDFLEKATWTLASALVVLTILASVFVSTGEVEQRSMIEDQVENAVDPSSLPFPTEAPPQNPAELPE